MMRRLLRRGLESTFWKDMAGQDLLEYSLTVGLVTVAAIAVMPGLGTLVINIFSKLQSFVDARVN